MKRKEKLLQAKLIEELNEPSIRDLSFDIKRKYVDSLEKTPNGVNNKTNKKNKSLVGILTTAGALALASAIIVPSVMAYNYNNTINPVSLNNKSSQIAYSVVSGTNIAVEQYAQTGSSVMNAIRMMRANEDQIKTELDTLNPFMYTCEGMIKEEFNVSPIIELSDRTGYEFKMNVEDLIISKESFVFYFNETQLIDDDDIDNDNEEDFDDDRNRHDYEHKGGGEGPHGHGGKEFPDGYDDSDETTFSLDGLIVLKDNTEYIVKGEKELDTEDNEYELEMKIFKDQNNYIHICQEREENKGKVEETYWYSFYNNGKGDTDVYISYERKGRFPGAMVEISRANSRNYSSYFITKPNDKSDSLSMNYSIGRREGELEIQIIYEEDGSSYYNYTDGRFSYKLPRR